LNQFDIGQFNCQIFGIEFKTDKRANPLQGDNQMADKKELIKNIPFAQAVNINELVDYEEGRVVSRTLSSKSHVNITLFAFDKGEEISAHTSPGDAMVQVLDGQALINIDGEKITAAAGQVVVMPANVAHSVFASSRFKMLLTVVKQPVAIKGL
jgi:quercetin dioxygenase-like cupin family protein